MWSDQLVAATFVALLVAVQAPPPGGGGRCNEAGEMLHCTKTGDCHISVVVRGERNLSCPEDEVVCCQSTTSPTRGKTASLVGSDRPQSNQPSTPHSGGRLYLKPGAQRHSSKNEPEMSTTMATSSEGVEFTSDESIFEVKQTTKLTQLNKAQTDTGNRLTSTHPSQNLGAQKHFTAGTAEGSNIHPHMGTKVVPTNHDQSGWSSQKHYLSSKNEPIKLNFSKERVAIEVPQMTTAKPQPSDTTPEDVSTIKEQPQVSDGHHQTGGWHDTSKPIRIDLIRQHSGWSGSWNILPTNNTWNLPSMPSTTTGHPEVKTSSTTTGHPEVKTSSTTEKSPLLLATDDKKESISAEQAEAIAEEKCKEYANYVFKEVQVILYPGANPGKHDSCASSTKPLIVGGEDAEPREFPHMARIGYGEENSIEWLCGGSLISERFILSAAHCAIVRNRIASWATLGDLDVSTSSDDASPVTIRIRQVFVLPGHNQNNNWYNDLALFKLEKDVELGINIRPACLNIKRRLEVTKAVASGWGLSKSLSPFVAEIRGDSGGNPKLQKAELKLIPNDQCNYTYISLSEKETTLKEYLSEGIRTDMICAGGIAGRAVCNGDSGGPLQIPRSNPYCMFDIIGVTSFGSGCSSDVPGVYTNVAEYVPWIVGNVWPTGK